MDDSVTEKKTGKTLFKKGQSGNPLGRPKDPFTKQAVEDIITRLSKLPSSEIIRIADDPNSTAREAMVAAQMKKALGGDTQALNLVFDRSIGKPKESLEVTKRNEALEDVETQELVKIVKSA